MLILIPGATGNLGQNLVRAAIRRGHQVRASGRNPAKLPEDLLKQIEGFVTISHFDDRASLDAACQGVDAIICAYGPDPILFLDAQLPVLRAAERAGIKRFHAASWNLIWDEMPHGTVESYDPLISFRRQAALTSTIKPLYVFCGVLAMTLFAVPGAGAMEGDSAMWVRKDDGKRMLNVIGESNVTTPYSVEADVADFSVALVTSDKAEQGGSYCFFSDEFTMKDLAATYQKVRGVECAINTVMDAQTCEKLLTQARANAAGQLNNHWATYAGLTYALMMARGTYNPKVLAPGFADVKRTSLEEYIRTNDYV